MSPQTTSSHPLPITTLLHENPDALKLTGKSRPVQSARFWMLAAMCACLNLAVITVGVYLAGFSVRSVSPPPEQRMAVPFAAESALWDSVRDWVVQEDGRKKPMDTYCRESIRAITGRERFEGNDPVAVVLSWMMLHEENRDKAEKIGKQLNCDWDHYPVLLCDHHELRELLYRDVRGTTADLSPQERFGKHVEPSVVHQSERFKNLVREAEGRRLQDPKAPLSQLEEKARELKKRLALYERIRAGGQEGREAVHAPGEFGVVALDQNGPTWFSLRGVRECVKDPTLWDDMMRARRIEFPQPYEGKSIQPIPKESLKQIDLAFVTAQDAYRNGSVEEFSSALLGLRQQIDQHSVADEAATTTTGLELWFNQTNPFRRAWMVGLLACLFLLASLALQNRRGGQATYVAGLLAYGGAMAWSVVGFYCRVAISGRPPVSNMYESVIWVGFMTAFFGLVLELIYRRRVIGLAGGLVATFGLVLADQLPLTLNPNIQPLQAVLRSNYWLIIHVLTIVSSYAAFALAWGLGNCNLACILFAPDRRDLIKTLSHYCYRAIQIGVVLLAAGTLLGGFWAAESWGRFWGWDPKEVWALIALLCYLIPLHARYVGWVKDFGLAACSVICFASVVMAWYGVNFVLGAGLHSYGFGGGNDLWVYWGGLLNISLVAHACLRYHGREALAVTA